MKYKTIAEIYDANDKIRARLKTLAASLPEDKANQVPDGEKWSAAQIVEHIAMVDEATMKICTKLLGKAKETGAASDGTATISDGFLQKGEEIASIRIEAPSVVQPSGGQTIAESIARMDENADRLRELRPIFETVGANEFKFPHPFFGEITAHEWLALTGGPELRHIKQIERLVKKIG